MDLNPASIQGKPQVDPETEQKVVEEAQAAKSAQQEADDLKRQAESTSSEDERDKLLAQSELREKEARDHSKEARSLATSAWQGSAAGAGIGTGLGTGTGALVGTLVGTIATIPMAGLGALVGLPVGLIHGPFFDTGKGKKGEAPSEDEQHEAVIKALDTVKDGDKDKE